LSRLPSTAVAVLLLTALALSLTFAARAADAPPPSTPPAGVNTEESVFGGAWDWFHKGGAIMYPIALTSLVGLAFVIERAVALRKRNALPDDFTASLTAHIDAVDVDAALDLCDRRPCSLSRVIKAALLRRSGTIQEMEKAAEDAGIRELWLIRRNVRPVGIVASVSPLLGLLGTISGMIGAFKTMGDKGGTMGNASAFAADIHEALFTTFFGLSVAIPMLVCFHWLEGRGESIIAEIEQVTGDLLLRLRDRRARAGSADQADRSDR